MFASKTQENPRTSGNHCPGVTVNILDAHAGGGVQALAVLEEELPPLLVLLDVLELLLAGLSAGLDAALSPPPLSAGLAGDLSPPPLDVEL